MLLNTTLLVLGGLSIPLYVAERVKNSHDREAFSEALEAADAGRWYWDLTTDELKWDDQMFRLFGRDRSTWKPTYEGFDNCLHPDDRARVREKVGRAVAERGGYHDTFRVITDEGDVIEIRASGLVSRSGEYMTGLNLPVKPREGNFRRERSETGSGLPYIVKYVGPPAETAADVAADVATALQN
jgi:PAS domain-containing protein